VSIVGYDKASRGAIAYLGLAGEIIRHQRERAQSAQKPRTSSTETSA
jgi:chromosome partitioning protein